MWTDAPPIKVMDCVLSLNRRYDGFVVPRVRSFKEAHPGVSTIEDLIQLMESAESPAAFSKTELNYRDPARAETLLGVLKYVNDVQGRYTGETEDERLTVWAHDVGPADHGRVGVKGFGIAGFQYLRMLFGVETTKPDVHVVAFVSEEVGRKVKDLEALELLEAAAAAANLPLRTMDVAIWESRARERT